jgi:hypothetical protein
MKEPRNIGTKCGNMIGAIKNTDSCIKSCDITIRLDTQTAWALCNVLSENYIKSSCGQVIETSQHRGLISLGAAIGTFIDHPNRNRKNEEAEL